MPRTVARARLSAGALGRGRGWGARLALIALRAHVDKVQRGPELVAEDVLVLAAHRAAREAGVRLEEGKVAAVAALPARPRHDVLVYLRAARPRSGRAARAAQPPAVQAAAGFRRSPAALCA